MSKSIGISTIGQEIVDDQKFRDVIEAIPRESLVYPGNWCLGNITVSWHIDTKESWLRGTRYSATAQISWPVNYWHSPIDQYFLENNKKAPYWIGKSDGYSGEPDLAVIAALGDLLETIREKRGM